MAKNKQLEDLFLDTLKDIYYAEKRILKGLRKLSGGAQSDELRDAFESHRDETQTHIERLERIFEMLERAARGKTCDAILGILEEGDEILEEFEGSDALDAGLVASAQAVEHYEMARYGSLRTWALELGMTEAADLLGQTLEEEKKADALLTELAEKNANRKAA
ncbi:ferritin-like domain-containing protein [Pelagibacterium montanilacus]|uniref:YciE/YciF ferroxidase family protein n=1 Tax=Pelagibacterium montanilacus TaxID=2185280 RepID=UPI000F8D0113|nr:ferritin-like domain-containing protein [Pelagibacterium montanilacus]